MPTHEFHCRTHGAIDLVVPMAQLDDPRPCPTCTEPMRRLFTTPHLNLGHAGARAALDDAARSAHEPSVVTSPPPARAARPVPARDPRTRNLPRP